MKVHGCFIDLLDELEKISIDFIDLSGFTGYTFINPDNESDYVIKSVINQRETYILENIPNGIFSPEYVYDFEIDFNNKLFKKLNQYTVINISEFEICNDDDIKSKNKNKNKSIFSKIFRCGK
jgi:hypothetical protein